MPDPRAAVRSLSLGRFAVGAAMLALPGPAGAAWIGDSAYGDGASALIRAFGARELFVGAATLAALDTPVAARVVAAGALVDGVDLVGTLAARDRLPGAAVAGVGAVAAGALVGGLALAVALRRS